MILYVTNKDSEYLSNVEHLEQGTVWVTTKDKIPKPRWSCEPSCISSPQISNDGSITGIQHRKGYQYWLGTEDDFGSFQSLGAESKLSCTGADTQMCKLEVSWYLSTQ